MCERWSRRAWPILLLTVNTSDLPACGQLCVDHVVPWWAAADRFRAGGLQSPSWLPSSLIRRAGCMLDGGGTGLCH